MPPGRPGWLARHYRLLMAGVLLVAAALRLVGLNNVSPPGLEHDEVAHWLINRAILAGEHAIYFSEAYGHEAGFHYVQAGLTALGGDNPLVLRLPSAYAGILLVAVTFALARRLFGLRTATLAAALLAVLFWPVFYSRLALRGIALPVLAGLSAVWWWRGWDEARGRTAAFAAAGLFAGLSLHTYMAARALPIFYLLYVAYLGAFHRPALRARGREVAIFFAVFATVAAPLVLYLLANPGAEPRVSEVDAPLRSLLSGDPGPVLRNSFQIAGMFGLRGDPLWRQNVAYLPVFDPLTAVFFTIGVGLIAWQWRQARPLFLILWLFAAAIPSMVTIDAPSSIRMVTALTVVTIFPVLGLKVIHILPRLSTVFDQLSPKTAVRLSVWALAMMFLLHIGRTADAVYRTWPASEEVQFVWQQSLTEAAAYLDRSASAAPVAIGGWTPETMDPPTMALTTRREDLSWRYFDPAQAIIIPAAAAGERPRLIRPAALPLAPTLESALAAWGAQPQAIDTFVLYELPGMPAVAAGHPLDANFGEEVALLGYEVASACPPSPCVWLTYWRVEAPAAGPRRFFLHLVDGGGQLLAQDDRLGAPAEHWRPGDVIVQQHSVDLPAGASGLAARLGVYDPATLARLPAAGGREFVQLAGTH